MLRLARMSDIDKIMDVVRAAREIMQSQGNFQWDGNYPLRSDFERDIDCGTLYLLDEGGAAAGFICLDGDQPEAYSGAVWENPEPCLIIHRMAVSPDFRGRGFAAELLDFALKKAEDDGIASIRTDTFSGNVPMNSLFLKHGFKKAGEIELPGKEQQPFCCYEKACSRD